MHSPYRKPICRVYVSPKGMAAIRYEMLSAWVRGERLKLDCKVNHADHAGHDKPTTRREVREEE